MSEVREFIRSKVAETLSVRSEDINPDEEFMSIGLDSMHAIFLIDEIEKKFGIEINPHSFWEHPTINSFAANLDKQIS
ncbi:MAG: acyl carrier protein [Cyclobacteriaceae bacterium]|nr:acyl carrier protein [Cyclobacteriaceae bacterium]